MSGTDQRTFINKYIKQICFFFETQTNLLNNNLRVKYNTIK